MENLSPQIIRRVAKEMAELAAQPPEGIRVILNEADITDIQAVIEGPCKIDRSFLAICAFSVLNYPSRCPGLWYIPGMKDPFIDHNLT